VVYDGASNLGAVVHDGRAQEALWFSDGLSNYGANAWSMNFPVPVYAVNAANSSNDAGLRALAKSSGGRLIDLTALNPAQASNLLLSRSNQLGQISALGAREVIAVAGSAESGLLQLAGILTAGQADITLKFALANGNSSTRTVRINSGQNPSRLAATWWAQNRLAELAADPRLHKTQIRNLGKRFGLVTPETSLLVLESE
jgi:Ca-activated chloride channel family protein